MAIAKHLLIVARHRRELYDQIKRAFAGHETVQVVLDRRATERRRGKEPTLPERRGADRRARSIIDDQLRTIGWSCCSISPRASAASRSRWCCSLRLLPVQGYTVAMGVAGEPTAPVSRRGGAVSRKRLRLC